MTIQTETVRVAAAPVIVLKGKGKQAREVAFMQTSALAYIDQLGRADLIANLRIALGSKPGEVELKTAQREVTIGRIAARLPASEFPKDCIDDDAKLEHARNLVMFYQQPAKPGTTAKLRKGMLGYRSEVQHKAIRAADEAWSQIKAEIGLGNAITGKDRKKATRATNANPVRGGGKSAAPNHTELATPPKAMTADEAHSYIDTQAATLLAFANKNAKLLCTDYGSAVQAFKQAINKAANDRAVRKAAKEAGEHNK